MKVSGTRPFKRGGDALCVATDSEDLKRSPKLFSVDRRRFAPLDVAEGDTLPPLPGDQLLLVGAERCVHCKGLYRQLERALDDATFAAPSGRYLDADRHLAPTAALGVRSLPTLLWLKDGQVQARLSGAQSADQLRVWLAAQSRRSE